MITLAQLNQSDRATFVSELGHLFEHSPWVAEETWPLRPFRNAEELHAKLTDTVRSASAERQLTLIRAHPDLAGRLAQRSQLTAESNREQASAGLNQLSATELAHFQNLNSEYRARYGFPFIICARLNAREAILSAMQHRVKNPPDVEHATALAEIEKIAWLRLQDVLKTA